MDSGSWLSSNILPLPPTSTSTTFSAEEVLLPMPVPLPMMLAGPSPSPSPLKPRRTLFRQCVHALATGGTSLPSSLKSHICPVLGCEKSFQRKYNLRVHMRKHSGETPYKCAKPNCAALFKWRSSLRHHMRTVHNQPHGPLPRPRTRKTSQTKIPKVGSPISDFNDSYDHSNDGNNDNNNCNGPSSDSSTPPITPPLFDAWDNNDISAEFIPTFASNSKRDAPAVPTLDCEFF